MVKHCDHFVNHCTSTYLCKRALMKTIIELHEQATGQKFTLKEPAELYAEKAEPATHITKRVGSTYTASVFVNLYSLLCSLSDEKLRGPERRISVYSYGSGSAATMYHLTTKPCSKKTLQIDRAVFERLSQRQPISVAEFHALSESYSGMYHRQHSWQRKQQSSAASEVPVAPPLEAYPSQRFVLQEISEVGVREYSDLRDETS